MPYASVGLTWTRKGPEADGLVEICGYKKHNKCAAIGKNLYLKPFDETRLPLTIRNWNCFTRPDLIHTLLASLLPAPDSIDWATKRSLGYPGYSYIHS